jgi:hypothetical protein
VIPDPESVRKQIPEGVTDVEFVVDPQTLAVSDLFEYSAAQTPHRARWFLHLTEEIKAKWQATSGDIPESTDGAAIQRYIAAAHNVIAQTGRAGDGEHLQATMAALLSSASV